MLAPQAQTKTVSVSEGVKTVYIPVKVLSDDKLVPGKEVRFELSQ